MGSTTPDRQRSTNYTINDVSLRTIPQLRQFANDTLMDVLYFMSPEHHDIIIDIVVNEMNFVVERFRRLTGFTGDVSVVGHSLVRIKGVLLLVWNYKSHFCRISSLRLYLCREVSSHGISWTTRLDTAGLLRHHGRGTARQ